MTVFMVGDVVTPKSKNEASTMGLKYGQWYIVESIRPYNGTLKVEGAMGGWYFNRFKLVSSPSSKPETLESLTKDFL